MSVGRAGQKPAARQSSLQGWLWVGAGAFYRVAPVPGVPASVSRRPTAFTAAPM